MSVRGVLVAIGLLAATLLPVQAFGARPASGPDCGGTLKKSTGGVWKCTMVDHFDGTALNTDRWSPVLTSETGVNTAECRLAKNVQVAGGTLRLTTRDEGTPFTCTSKGGDYETQYSGGGVSSRGKFDQTYGRIEFRAKMPAATVAGLHAALWSWPTYQKYGDLSGEIDLGEWRSNIHDRMVPAVHYDDDGTDTNKVRWDCLIDRPHEFHTYVLEWTRETLSFIYDGEVCMVNRWSPAAPLVKPAPFDEPIFLVMTMGVGIGHNAVTADTPFPATMEIDHVKVWK